VASNTSANAILQGSIDGRIRGRVSSLYTLALRGGAPLGSLATGAVTTTWDVRTAFLVNGALGLAFHLAFAAAGRRKARARRASPST
jgi:MFS family permease